MRQIYINGDVYTVDNGFEEAFVVEDGKFLYVGNTEHALSFKESNSKVINLNKQFVCPGFNDSHMHVLGYGYSLRMIDLSKCTSSLKEMKATIKDYINKDKIIKNSWIRGRGFNNDYFNHTNNLPTKYDLDEISTEYPMCMIRACGHVCVVNSKALELLNINSSTPQVDGGAFDIDENGEPIGIFRENALNLIYDNIPSPSDYEIKEMIYDACKSLNSYGVTSAQTDDFIVFPKLDYEKVIQAYKDLEKENKLSVRIYEQAQLVNKGQLEEFLDKGYNTGYGSNFFKIGPLKLLGDGSLGARTAYLNEPYSDDTSTSGICIYTQEQFDDLIECAHKNNMQVAVHGIGDKIMDMIIEAIEKALAKYPRDDHRHGIVHCQITSKSILDKFEKLKLVAYVQSIFLDYDINIIEDRVGSERASTSYNFKTLMNSANLSNGSDCPVEPPNVMSGMYCMVTRKSLNGKWPFLENECVSVKEAIDSFTINGAFSSFEEDLKGSISVGKLADFVLLDRSPFLVDVDDIKDIKVVETYVNGVSVYRD